MISSKIFNKVFLITTGFLIPIAIFWLIFSIGFYASYHYKDFYTAPSLRYFYIYIAFAIFLFSYAIYSRCKSKLSISNWVLVALLVSYPIYFLSGMYKIDIPETVYFENEKYDIPWEYNPSAEKAFFTNFDYPASNYVGFSTSYPEFYLPISIKNRKEKYGYDVQFTKMNNHSLEKSGYYLGECIEKFLNLENTKTVSAQQMKDAILNYLDIQSSSGELFSEWVNTEACKIQFFQQNDNQENAKMYGVCKQYPKYISCDYIVEEKEIFYSIGLYSNNPESIRTWNKKNIFPIIERETKKMLNSFLQK